MRNAHSFAIAAVVAAAVVGPTDAAVYDFAYLYSFMGEPFVLAGRLEGALQPDNNRVVVSAILGIPTVNGVPVLPLTFVQSFDENILGVAADPTVSLDGSLMDMIACTDGVCVDGFLFSTNAAIFGVPVFVSGPAFGNISDVFVPDNWSMSLVPEPGSWALLVAGFGIMGVAARRRRAIPT
jgi:hypothetical protein